MFGHDNHDDQNNDNDMVQSAPLPPPEPAADGTLGSDTPVTPTDSGFGMSPASDTTPPTEPDSATTPTVDAADNDALLDIKQQALQQLTPLIGHLDQTPEEKFRTTMMMIQGSDNQDLIKDAYEAAQQITDEKMKAQALLDIVNEINYFTQHPSAS